MSSRYLITGGCGSIGSALVKRLALKGNTVCSFDHNEEGLFKQIHSMPANIKNNVKTFVGDIRDLKRVEQALNGVDYVYHCAALKHVELSEYNPFESLKTNVVGTNNILTASIQASVKGVVITSSDKAVNPSSTMGASKLLAERLVISSNSYIGDKPTKLSCVRFGNVWNTAGSVGQIFKEQCINNQNLTLTSEEMTRFFISIESALDLCEYAMKNMLGGEIFVCDMGSLSIKDLAIRFQNKYKSSNKIKIIGIKPGEKNYEELYTDQESLRTIKLDNYYVILPDSIYLQNTHTQWKNKRNIKKVSENIALSSTQSTKILNPDDLINNL